MDLTNACHTQKEDLSLIAVYWSLSKRELWLRNEKDNDAKEKRSCGRLTEHVNVRNYRYLVKTILIEEETSGDIN